MTVSISITDRPTGVTLTAYRDSDTPALRYKITTSGGGELDLNAADWSGVVELVTRWQDGEA